MKFISNVNEAKRIMLTRIDENYMEINKNYGIQNSFFNNTANMDDIRCKKFTLGKAKHEATGWVGRKRLQSFLTDLVNAQTTQEVAALVHKHNSGTNFPNVARAAVTELVEIQDNHKNFRALTIQDFAHVNKERAGILIAREAAGERKPHQYTLQLALYKEAKSLYAGTEKELEAITKAYSEYADVKTEGMAI